MKKLVTILIIFASCYSPKKIEYKVTEIKPMWKITAKSARGTETFLVDCPPDSVGSRFMAKPKSIKN